MTPFNLATMSEDIGTSKVLEGKALKHHDLPQKLDSVKEEVEAVDRIVRAPSKSRSPDARKRHRNDGGRGGSPTRSTVPTPRDAKAATDHGSPGPPPMMLKAPGGASGPPITIKRKTTTGGGGSPSGSTTYTVSSQRRQSVERHHSKVNMASLKPSTLPAVASAFVRGPNGSGGASGHINSSGSKYEHMDAKRKRHEERRAHKEEAHAQRRVRHRGDRRGDGERRAKPSTRVRHPREVEQHDSHPANRSLSVMKPRRGPKRTYNGSNRHGGGGNLRGAQSESVLPTLPNIGASRNTAGRPGLAKRGSNRALHSESVASTCFWCNVAKVACLYFVCA